MLNALIDVAREAGAIIRSARDAERSVTEKTGPRDLITKKFKRKEDHLIQMKVKKMVIII